MLAVCAGVCVCACVSLCCCICVLVFVCNKKVGMDKCQILSSTVKKLLANI